MSYIEEITIRPDGKGFEVEVVEFKEWIKRHFGEKDE